MAKKKKATAAVKPAEAPVSHEETIKSPTVDIPGGEIHQMEAGEVLTPDNDLAVAQAAIAPHDPILPIAEDSKSKEILAEDSELKEDIEKGDVVVPGSGAAADLSVVAQPMVPNPVTGQPVYATSDQYRMAEAAKGNLSTPPPTAEQIEAAKG